MRIKRRIFWSSEEKSAVLASARDLRNQQPRWTLRQVGTRAQATLPKQRRRPVNNKLSSWLSAELKTSEAKSASPPRAKNAKATPLQTATTTASVAQLNVMQTLIEHGAAILSGILSHPSVQAALSSTSRGPVSRRR